MRELYFGGNEIVNGMKYHFENYLLLEQKLSFYYTVDYYVTNRELINKMNHESAAFFNRIGQFYYFANSKEVSKYIDNPLDKISKIKFFKIFRDKQSAHRAIDEPRKSDPRKIDQLHRLFTYQYIIVNGSLLYQIILDESHSKLQKMSLNFVMKSDGREIISEATSIISSLSNF